MDKKDLASLHHVTKIYNVHMTKTNSDVAVIGGGPAGMMAAIQASNNHKTILLEKNHDLGQKLLLTGHGRCNLTAAMYDVDLFINQITRNGEFLYSCLYEFGVRQTIDFFESHGVPIKQERGKRIFPQSDKAEDIVNCLKDTLGQNQVEIHLNTQVQQIQKQEDLFIVKTADSVIQSKAVIITTGGLSYPATGSTGEGYEWAKQLGHNIITPTPALVPLIVKEEWVEHLQGLSLKNVNISIYQNNKKQTERFGEALFTDKGMSGPIIIDMSEEIGKLLTKGDIELRIDFKPALSFPQLDNRLIREFDNNGKKMFKNVLENLLPQKAISTFIQLTEIPASKPCHQITGEERNKLLHLLKEFTLHVDSLFDIEYAIVTAGGIDLKQIDSQTMQSKVVDKLFFAGEILDVHGPTGGYNLQICWSTGYVAGKNAAKHINKQTT